MNSFFRSFFKYILNSTKTHPLVYFAVFVITCSLILGGRHVLKQHHKNTEITQVTQITTPEPSIISSNQENAGQAIRDEESEDEDDDTEEDKDDTDTPSASAWPILKTALHGRYYEPSSKQKSTSIVIILTGLGLNKTMTQQLLTTLDKKFTLAFSPYSPNLKEQLENAKNFGFQVIVTLPMEPHSYPNPDPGPFTVLSGVKATENQNKIKPLLDNLPRGLIILGEYGSKFLSSSEDLTPVLLELKNHGHSFIDPNTSMLSLAQSTCKDVGMPCFQVDTTLSQDADVNEINNFVNNIIQNSKENGTIIVSVPAIHAVTKQISEWTDTLTKNGINLVTIAGISTPELRLGVSRDDQGIKDVNQ